MRQREGGRLINGVFVANVEILLIDHIYAFRPIFLLGVPHLVIFSGQLHFLDIVVNILFSEAVNILELGQVVAEGDAGHDFSFFDLIFVF